MTRRLTAFLLIGAGCANSIEMPAPQVAAVKPSQGFNGFTTTIRVTGTGFALLPEKFLDGENETVAYPQVFLETTPPTPLATGSFMLGPTEIQVTVPAGLAPGKYGITVVNPDGARSTLPGAFVVTNEPDIRIDRLTPPFGWTGSRTNVSITGAGFVSTPKVTLVKDGVETALTRVAFLDQTSISALVPQGLAVGIYSVLVTNPDGGGGVLQSAFRVSADPPPTIAGVTPAVAGSGGGAVAVTVTGASFRAGATVVLVDPAEQELSSFGSTTVDSASEIHTTLSSTPSTGAYLLRVKNTDGTFGDFSAFVVKPTSLKLESMDRAERADGTAIRLSFARRGLGAVSGKDDLGNTFLYAVAGDDGTSLLDTIEVAQVDPFGRLGAWRVVPYRTAPRTRASTVIAGRYIHMLGGRGPDGSTEIIEPATNRVIRAKILGSETAPVITRAEGSTGGSLAEGTWYYKVAGMGNDPDNIFGESLPSDEVVVEATEGGRVVLEWNAVPGATAYRVYRTDGPNGVSGQEHRIQDVGALTFTDTGLAAGTAAPQPTGAVGQPIKTIRMLAPRTGAAAVTARTATGAWFLYVIGGEGAAGDGLTDWEMAPLATDGKLAGPFVAGATALPYSVIDAAAIVVDRAAAPALPSGAKPYLYVLGGTRGAGASEGVIWAEVQDDGSLTFREVSWNTFNPTNRPGMGAICANNVLYMMGGMSGSAPTATSRQTEFSGMNGTTREPIAGNASSASAQFSTPRAFFGMTIANAFVYAIGGTNGTTALDTTDQGIW